MGIENFNVIFITLDSLPYHIAKSSKNLFLNKISCLKMAETHGTYTYPAHHSFFLGLIPRLVGSKNQYLNKYTQIWRSSSANSSEKTIAITFNEKNILEHYKAKGYQTIGFGGVPFFNTTNNNNTLPKLFDEFYFFGPYKRISKLKRIPRKPEWFPLNNIENIVSKIQKGPYFLFINSIATHIPYDNPLTEITNKDKDTLAKIYKEHDLKNTASFERDPISKEDIERVVTIQKESLYWVDKQIEKLIQSLSIKKPSILIVCADHGEEFGENGRFGHAHADATVMTVPYWDCILD